VDLMKAAGTILFHQNSDLLISCPGSLPARNFSINAWSSRYPPFFILSKTIGFRNKFAIPLDFSLFMLVLASDFTLW
jgi:hypothetical protein